MRSESVRCDCKRVVVIEACMEWKADCVVNRRVVVLVTHIMSVLIQLRVGVTRDPLEAE
jgi:hypothetical protein